MDRAGKKQKLVHIPRGKLRFGLSKSAKKTDQIPWRSYGMPKASTTKQKKKKKKMNEKMQSGVFLPNPTHDLGLKTMLGTLPNNGGNISGGRMRKGSRQTCLWAIHDHNPSPPGRTRFESPYTGKTEKTEPSAL